MLQITIPKEEIFDEKSGQFLHVKETKLQLEHSLISLRKWESKWHKPFLKKDEKTNEELLDYIRCMTLTPNVDPDVYYFIPPEVHEEIQNYIEDPMTATWFSEDEKKGASGHRKIVTAELIYYWMITLNIPVEFQKWHLNQLLTLIRVINAENEPRKKMSQKAILARNKRLNAQRRAKYNTKG